MPARKLFPALLLAILLASYAAAENITELRIGSITTPIVAGGRLEFSFTAGNRSGPECSAQLEYGFGNKSGKSLQGTDSFYLGSGESVSQEISLIMPSDTEGVKELYLQMQCNDSTILASRVIEITGLFPEIPQLSGLAIGESEAGKQIQFSYVLQSSSEGKSVASIEERIVQDDNILWANAQNIAVSGSTQIERFGPVLQPGSYRLIVEARHGSEKARIAREFAVGSPVAPQQQALPVAAIALAAAMAGFAAISYFAFVKRPYAKQRAAAAVKAAAEGEKLPLAGNEICLAESEASGVLDEQHLEDVLQLAGIEGSKRVLAAEFAGRTQVTQAVKSCIIFEKGTEARFETRIEIRIQNNSNRNWQNLVMLAKIPDFLGKKISLVSADVKLAAFRRKQVIRFNAEKVKAMRSARIRYILPRLVSQEEANSIPLPAVIEYEESEPLVITQVKTQGEESPGKNAVASGGLSKGKREIMGKK